MQKKDERPRKESLPVPKIGAIGALAAKGAGLVGGISTLANQAAEEQRREQQRAEQRAVANTVVISDDEDEEKREEAPTALGMNMKSLLLNFQSSSFLSFFAEIMNQRQRTISTRSTQGVKGKTIFHLNSKAHVFRNGAFLKFTYK